MALTDFYMCRTEYHQSTFLPAEYIRDSRGIKVCPEFQSHQSVLDTHPDRGESRRTVMEKHGGSREEGGGSGSCSQRWRSPTRWCWSLAMPIDQHQDQGGGRRDRMSLPCVLSLPATTTERSPATDGGRR